MLSSEEIQEYISANFKNQFQDSFPLLKNTRIGSPIPVFDQNKEQKYWLIPFLLKTKVRGSAILDINGKLVTHGVLYPNVQDEQKLVDCSYFEKVPEKSLKEVRKAYKEYEVVSYYFSFDQTPQKWGWRIYLKNSTSPDLIMVFVNPGGWYEKRVQKDNEG